LKTPRLLHKKAIAIERQYKTAQEILDKISDAMSECKHFTEGRRSNEDKLQRLIKSGLFDEANGRKL